MTPEDVDPGPSFYESYRIDRLLGAGSMGSVYAGVQLATGRPVAVKFLIRTHDSEQQARFERELAVLRRVQHPHVVAVLDGAMHRGNPWMVLEFVDGGTLAEHIAREKRLEPAAAVAFARDILSGLAACHAMGIMHRDVKPANVLLTSTGRAKLGDLGIAREEVSDANLTGTGFLLGTPLYMPPEVLIDGLPSTAAADLYSVGAVLHEMLCGTPPVVGSNVPDICAQHALARKPLATRAPHVPEQLAALVDRAVGKDPRYRPQTALAFLDDLERVSGPIVISGEADSFAVVDAAEKKPARPATELVIRGGKMGQVIAGTHPHSPPIEASPPVVPQALVPAPPATLAPKEPVELRESGAIAVPMIGFAPFTIALAACAGDPVVSIFALAALALVGGAVKDPLLRVLRGAPALTIDDDGFEDHRTGIGRVLWNDVRSLKLIPGKSPLIHIALGDPDRYGNMTMYGMLTCRFEKEPRKANLFLGAGALRLTAVQIHRLLDERWRRARTSSGVI